MRRIERWSQRLKMPPVLVRYWAWTVGLTLLSLVYTEIMIHGLHSSRTLGPLVLWNDDRWWDFLVFQERFSHFRTPAFWDAFDYPFTYPAAMGVVFAAMYRVPHALRIYLLICVTALVVWAWVVARGMELHAAASEKAWGTRFVFALTIVATAWPVWLLLGSANTEGLVALLLAGGVWAVLRGKWLVAAALIGVGGALKIFPLVMLALLLGKRRYKEFAGGLAIAAAVTLASLAVLGPSVAEAQRHIWAGLDFVKQTYALDVRPQSLDENHSFFTVVKFITVGFAKVLHHHDKEPLEASFDVYVVVAGALGIVLWWWRIRWLPMLNQVLALTVCAVLLPPYSVDYTLVQLLLPCGLLCVYAVRNDEAKGLDVCFACFALIFTVGTFFTAGYRFGSQVRMAALVVLLVAALRNPFWWDELETR